MGKFKYSGVFINNKANEKAVKCNAKGVLTQLYNTITRMDFSSANKLLYWLNDWSGFILPNEKIFKYSNMIKYEQYSIIEMNLGFNVGSEVGGLHYGVVVDKNNTKSSRVLMVVPFKSLDDDKTVDDIDEKTEVYLGNKVFAKEAERQTIKLSKINAKIEKYNETDEDGNFILSKDDENYRKLLKKKSFYETEISKFSRGTIAQVGQIRPVSKMRIYYPTSTSEKLYGLKLSDENIRKIKEKFDEIYF